MKLKLAGADFSFPLLPHDRVLQLLALLEMDGVDIGLFEGRSHLQPSSVFRNIRASARTLRRNLDAVGLKPADVFLQAAPDFVSLAANQPDSRRRARARTLFLQTLEYTAACGGRHVSGLPGVYFETESHAASWARCCEELAWRCEQARAVGLVFSVEAHVGSIAPTPREALRLVAETPGLTLTLDYTHFTRRGIPDATIEPLVRHASHFHARGACRGRLQVALDKNTIDYAHIVKVMRQTGYAGYVGIEYVWTNWEHCNEVDNVSETIQLRDLIRKAWRG